MKKLTREELIAKFISVHGNKYDYSNVIYINYDSKVEIKCNCCGEIFWQRPSHHCAGIGCPKCAKNKKHTTEEFIKLAKEVHGDKYLYDKVVYKNQHTKVIIVCPKHGEFLQQPNSHLWGRGCPKCADRKLTTEKFVEKAKCIHGNKYDYSETKYINKRTKLKIKCTICNKYFYIYPNNHIQGKQGCPCQKPRSTQENKIAKYLSENNIKFIRQKYFEGCKFKHTLAFDFYLPDYNTCVEFQGQQHYDVVKGWGGEEGLKIRQQRDQIKRDFCIKEAILLLEIRYDENVENALQNFFKNFL